MRKNRPQVAKNDLSDSVPSSTRSLQSPSLRVSLHRRAFSLNHKLKQITDVAAEKVRKESLALLKREKPDDETLRYLRILQGIERPMTNQQMMDLASRKAAERAIDLYVDQVSRINEHCIPLTLTHAGDLYKEPKTKYCYSLQGAKNRLKILRALLRRKGFYPSKELQKDTSCASYNALTFAIHEINRIAQNKLPLVKKQNLIIAKQPNGYALNELYPITEE